MAGGSNRMECFIHECHIMLSCSKDITKYIVKFIESGEPGKARESLGKRLYIV